MQHPHAHLVVTDHEKKVHELLIGGALAAECAGLVSAVGNVLVSINPVR